jgi:hypothetical protein
MPWVSMASVSMVSIDTDHADAGVGHGSESGVPAEPLRLAVMDLHLSQRVATSVGVMYQSVTYVSGNAAVRNCALGLSYDADSLGTIICKQVMAQDEGITYFVPYSNMSASGEDA